MVADVDVAEVALVELLALMLEDAEVALVMDETEVVEDDDEIEVGGPDDEIEVLVVDWVVEVVDFEEDNAKTAAPAMTIITTIITATIALLIAATFIVLSFIIRRYLSDCGVSFII